MAERGWMGSQNEALVMVQVPARFLEPNPWNPNVMSPEMFDKEVRSIQEFGFVDPLTIREHGTDRFQIIDGEHRWKAGMSIGMEQFPCIVIDVDDDTAKELTIVLNETRGTSDQVKLADLVRDLAQRRDQARLQVLPFTPQRLRAMITNSDQIDWDSLRDKREKMKQDREHWVERVFRMPVEAARVLDEAVAKVKAQEGIDQEWRALEMIAADVLASE
jgi:ParB family transcriptional regulator, chromosome partitioning protein